MIDQFLALDPIHQVAISALAIVAFAWWWNN